VNEYFYTRGVDIGKMERQYIHLARDAVLAKMSEYQFLHLLYNYEFYVGKLS